jgi:hypothetical protein
MLLKKILAKYRICIISVYVSTHKAKNDCNEKKCMQVYYLLKYYNLSTPWSTHGRTSHQATWFYQAVVAISMGRKDYRAFFAASNSSMMVINCKCCVYKKNESGSTFHVQT